MKKIMIITLIIVALVAVVFLLSKICTSTQSEELDTESSLPPLRSNEQMLEFILKSAKECFGDPNITLSEYGYGHSRSALQLNIPDCSCLLVIYPCKNKTEYDSIENCLSVDAATEFRSYPVRYYHYGDMIIVLYCDQQRWRVEKFLESVVIDTRQGLVLAQRWQQWLVEKGIKVKIADEGFGLIRHPFFTGDSNQTLPILVDGHKVKLICYTNATLAEQTLNHYIHLQSVKFLPAGAERYDAYRYGRFLIMTLLDDNKIELFVNAFWSKQNL